MLSLTIILSLITKHPIVSSGTLRPDHLCSALISEADRLGITLRRELWQPAAAISAHGQYGGACLDLPPKLQDIAQDIVSELFDALNNEAPNGFYLGASEGDGSLILWSFSFEAEEESINSDPTNV
jgi:hypothetical protein